MLGAWQTPDERAVPEAALRAPRIRLHLMWLPRLPVVCVREIDSRRADVEELLAVPGDRVGQFDDVHDLGAAEAGDLH